MALTTITEKCGCGATFNVATEWLTLGKKAAAEWREGHKHAERVGICGDQPPSYTLEGVEIQRPHCELRAGHTGMHGNDRGENWTRVALMDDDAQEGAQ